ncbi:MAG: GTP 3',8-cyclase MoaA, partial [Eubacteriales bacterium]|nr:GTP 3',8-cyclase MoaA [Eubacteriales bacterium]
VRCNRVRLTSKGYLKTCLSYEDGVDLREILRRDGSAQEKQLKLEEAMAEAVLKKPMAHCFEHPEQMTEQHDMVEIGG